MPISILTGGFVSMLTEDSRMKYVSTVTRFFHCPLGGPSLAWQATQNDHSSSSVFRMHVNGKALEISQEVFCALMQGRRFKSNPSEYTVRSIANSHLLGVMDFTYIKMHYWENDPPEVD